jgi:hypothetical protein
LSLFWIVSSLSSDLLTSLASALAMILFFISSWDNLK